MKRSQPAPSPFVLFCGDIVLRLNKNEQVSGKFRMRASDGMLPGHVELMVDPEAADIAWRNGPSIKLEVCGVKIRTHIIGANKHTSVLLLYAASFVRSIARAIAAYDK